MKTINKLLISVLLTLILVACGDDTATSNSDKVYQINGVFGLNIGDQGPNLPEGYLENNKAFDFNPNPAHKSFVTYTFVVTPNTHLVYGIKVKGVKELERASCKEQRTAMIKETLATLGDISTLTIMEESKWIIREYNQREISIQCERALNGGHQQLVMTYSDASLSKLSFVEWSKHQDDITKPQ